MEDGHKLRLPGSLRILCEVAPEYGIDAEHCLEGTGLVVFDLYDNAASVTLAQEIRAIENFVRASDRQPGLGIRIGQRYRPQVFGIWGYAILSSPTFRASLQVATKYANLSFIIATARLVEDNDTALLTFDSSGLPLDIRSFVLQRHLTVLSNFSLALLPGFKLSRFVFETTLSSEQEAQAIEKDLGIKVRLNCPHDAIVLPDNFLDTPLPKHDPEVLKACLKQCQDLLGDDKDRNESWTNKVKDVVMVDLAGEPNIVSTAKKLSVTERTLRRRLSEEGTSFRNILVEARLAIGHELLSTAKLDVSTVAYRTGYSEPSSFVRAFSQHYGYSPGSVKFGATKGRRASKASTGR